MRSGALEYGRLICVRAFVLMPFSEPLFTPVGRRATKMRHDQPMCTMKSVCAAFNYVIHLGPMFILSEES